MADRDAQSTAGEATAGEATTAREVAALARLGLTSEEAALFGGELARILGAFRTLEQAEVAGVEPLVAPGAGGGGLRADRPVAGLARGELLSRAPETGAGPEGGEPVFLRVPRVIGEERDG